MKQMNNLFYQIHLSDPIIEQLVKRRTAETYEVKAGEYIQIIDPGGRQCSDFLAFDTQKLNDGIESIIDDKATEHLWVVLTLALVCFQSFMIVIMKQWLKL